MFQLKQMYNNFVRQLKKWLEKAIKLKQLKTIVTIFSGRFFFIKRHYILKWKRKVFDDFEGVRLSLSI